MSTEDIPEDIKTTYIEFWKALDRNNYKTSCLKVIDRDNDNLSGFLKCLLDVILTWTSLIYLVVTGGILIGIQTIVDGEQRTEVQLVTAGGIVIAYVLDSVIKAIRNCRGEPRPGPDCQCFWLNGRYVCPC